MFASTDKILIMGRTGCGKSTLGRAIQKLYPRKIIFDTLDEYQPSDDTQHVYTWAQFSARIASIYDEAAGAWRIPRFTLVYHFDLEAEDNTIELDEVLKIVFMLGNVLVVIEELDAYATPAAMPLWLRNCVTKGRHRNVSMIFTTQRPGICNKTILSQCSHVFVGSLQEKNDLNYVSSVLFKLADTLPSLPPRKFLLFRPGHPIIGVTNDLAKREAVPHNS